MNENTTTLTTDDVRYRLRVLTSAQCQDSTADFERWEDERCQP